MEEIWAKFLVPFFMPLVPSQRIFVLYIVSALLLAFLAYVAARRSSAGFLRYCFPRSVFTHPSAMVDYGYFFVNKIGLTFLGGMLLLSATAVSAYVRPLLEAAYGGPGPGHEPTALAIGVLTVVFILAFDLGLFIAHYMQHKIPLLWQFHKVHHSAEVMTPITVYRMHPVDDILAAVLVGGLTGAVHGVFGFLYADGIAGFEVWKINVFLFLFYVFGYNLRHSHIWLAYPVWLSHFLVSPAQHQIHHSAEARHFDRNIAFMFAFWDWIAGTLYVPTEKEEFELGLDGGEHREFNSVWKLYYLPFKKAAALFGHGPAGENV